MAKQLLIYESAVPVSVNRHGNVSIESSDRYAFSAELNAVPLMAVEFPQASVDYPIVFTTEGDVVMPTVVLGVQPGQNLFLGDDARWLAPYVPAFVRRYPFVFADGAEADTLTLCLDETHVGVNREGRGQALFEAGQPTPYIQGVLEFLKEYQMHFERSRAAGQRLKSLGLLESVQADITTPAGEKHVLGGFLVVSREKLKALSGEALSALAQSDELELVFLHLASLRNFDKLKDRLAAVAAPGTQPAPRP